MSDKILDGLKAAVMERLCLDLTHSWGRQFCANCDKRPPSVEYAVKLYLDAKAELSRRDKSAEAGVSEAKVFSECEGKLRAAASILDSEARKAEEAAEGASGLREAAKDLRGAAARAGLARLARPSVPPSEPKEAPDER